MGGEEGRSGRAILKLELGYADVMNRWLFLFLREERIKNEKNCAFYLFSISLPPKNYHGKEVLSMELMDGISFEKSLIRLQSEKYKNLIELRICPFSKK